MKRIEITNGEVRLGYELEDLPSEIQEHLIDTEKTFLLFIDEDYEDFDDIDNATAIEHLQVNKYLWDETGAYLPIRYYMKDDEVVKTVYEVGEKEYGCVISKI